VREGEQGQALVEAAFILPAMIFLLLLTIQLTQLQQARIMAEYAAFAAARAGIVMNGNNGSSNGFDGPMHDAAVMAVLPTFGRTDSFTHLGATLLRFKAEDAVLRPFALSQVRVYVLSPTKADFTNFGQHLNGKEIDFDDVRPAAADATLLSLQVRYFYEMKVPFANKLIQTIWLASKAGVLRTWQGADWTGPRIGGQNGGDAVGISRGLALGRVVPDGTPEGIPLGGLVAAGALNRYYLPVEAWYTMRMQSNPYVAWAHP
jgi:TadE-like protein